MKYICSFDPDYGWNVEEDDPSYDGPETNSSDPYGTYHIEADNAEEAIKFATYELEIDS